MKLNAAQLACLRAGGTPEQIAALATAPEANAPGNPLAADANAAPGADDAAAQAANQAAASGAATPAAPPAGDGGAAPAAAAAPAAPAAAAQPSDLVAHLTAQLSDVNAQLLTAKVEAETYKTQAAQVEPLVTVLRGAIGEKLVALGGSADIAAGYTATNIAAEYARIDGVFKANFRVGGVAATAAPEDKPTTKADTDPMLAAQMANSLVK